MRYLAAALCVVILALVAPGGSQARDQFNQKDAVTLRPEKAYIFYRATARADVQFIREVAPAQRAAYDTARAEAYRTARARYERQFATWSRDAATCVGVVSLFCQGLVRPVLVSPETFFYPPAELANLVGVDRGPQFTRDGDAATYLIAVDPGVYMLYGQVTTSGSNLVGTCLCMGTVRFEARAGRIVDVGQISYVTGPLQTARGASSRRFTSIEVQPAGPALALPARLSGLPVYPAELRASVGLPNYFKVEVDRLTPIPGIIGYQRGRVMDLRTGAPAPRAP